MATVGQTSPFWLRSATHNANPVNKARHAIIRVSNVHGEDPGTAAQVGTPAKVAVGRLRVDVELYGTDPSDIMALPDAAAANVVLGTVGDGAANETHTLKSVKWHTLLGQLDMPDPDNPGGTISAWGVAGTCQVAANDTLATLWVTA